MEISIETPLLTTSQDSEDGGGHGYVPIRIPSGKNDNRYSYDLNLKNEVSTDVTARTYSSSSSDISPPELLDTPQPRSQQPPTMKTMTTNFIPTQNKTINANEIEIEMLDDIPSLDDTNSIPITENDNTNYDSSRIVLNVSMHEIPSSPPAFSSIPEMKNLSHHSNKKSPAAILTKSPKTPLQQHRREIRPTTTAEESVVEALTNAVGTLSNLATGYFGTPTADTLNKSSVEDGDSSSHRGMIPIANPIEGLTITDITSSFSCDRHADDDKGGSISESPHNESSYSDRNDPPNQLMRSLSNTMEGLTIKDVTSSFSCDHPSCDEIIPPPPSSKERPNGNFGNNTKSNSNHKRLPSLTNPIEGLTIDDITSSFTCDHPSMPFDESIDQELTTHKTQRTITIPPSSPSHKPNFYRETPTFSNCNRKMSPITNTNKHTDKDESDTLSTMARMRISNTALKDAPSTPKTPESSRNNNRNKNNNAMTPEEHQREKHRKWRIRKLQAEREEAELMHSDDLNGSIGEVFSLFNTSSLGRKKRYSRRSDDIPPDVEDCGMNISIASVAKPITDVIVSAFKTSKTSKNKCGVFDDLSIASSIYYESDDDEYSSGCYDSDDSNSNSSSDADNESDYSSHYSGRHINGSVRHIQRGSEDFSLEDEQQAKGRKNEGEKNCSIKSFLDEISSDGIGLKWHMRQNIANADISNHKQLPAAVQIRAYIHISDCLEDGDTMEPYLVWLYKVKKYVDKDDENYNGNRKKQSRNHLQQQQCSLFDITYVQKATDATDLGLYPRIHTNKNLVDNCVIVQLNNGTTFIFETKDAREAKKVIHGFRWIVARLSFNLVIGNRDTCLELLMHDIPSLQQSSRSSQLRFQRMKKQKKKKKKSNANIDSDCSSNSSSSTETRRLTSEIMDDVTNQLTEKCFEKILYHNNLQSESGLFEL